MMRVLVSDNDMYVWSLERALARRGGTLVFTNFGRALTLFGSEFFDEVIFDVDKATPGDTGDPYATIQEIVKSDWARTHTLTVYTRTPRQQFLAKARERGISLEKVAYYSKRGPEVPPALECLAAAIRGDPSLVGNTAPLRRPPKSVTRRWIASHVALYSSIWELLSQWVAEYEREEDLLETLPLGMRRIWKIGCMEGEICNGGFGQFFANRAQKDDAFDATEYREALHTFGIEDGADLVESAMNEWRVIWERDKESTPVACAVPQTSEAGEGAEVKLHALDRRFFELRDSGLASRIDMYIRQHPLEFVCRKKQ